MGRPWVKAPGDMLRDAELSDRAMRLWLLIRGRNGEEEFKGCWESGRNLALNLVCGGAKRQLRGTGDWRFKTASAELVGKGLLVVRRSGPGRPASRWALGPGAHGDLELNDLFQRSLIDDQLFQSVQARRAAQYPSDGGQSDDLVVGGPPTIQNQSKEPEMQGWLSSRR